MRIDPLHVGHEPDLPAVMLRRNVDQPVEQSAAVSLRARALGRDEVFDFEIASAGEPLGDAVSRDGLDAILVEVGDAQTRELRQARHQRSEFVGADFRSQLRHHGETAGDFGGRFRDGNSNHRQPTTS
jgi:hypothetical protein